MRIRCRVCKKLFDAKLKQRKCSDCAYVMARNRGNYRIKILKENFEDWFIAEISKNRLNVFRIIDNWMY